MQEMERTYLTYAILAIAHSHLDQQGYSYAFGSCATQQIRTAFRLLLCGVFGISGDLALRISVRQRLGGTYGRIHEQQSTSTPYGLDKVCPRQLLYNGCRVMSLMDAQSSICRRPSLNLKLHMMSVLVGFSVSQVSRVEETE